MDSPVLSSPPVRVWPKVLVALLCGGVIGFGVRELPQTVLPPFLSQRIYGEERVIGLNQSPPEKLADDIEFKRFWELWKLLQEKYYIQPVKDRDLFYGAMSGLAQSVGDPYTTYFEPKVAQEFQESLQGKFEGIGAEIGSKDDILQIIAPLPETPAERAGLMAGDILIKINNEDTVGMTVEKAVSLIRGPKGTKVTLNVLRPSQKKPPFDVTITRDVIKIKSVRSKMLPNQIGVIELTNFNGDTSEAFREAVREVLRNDPKGLILDLRNDPGGFLDTAIDVASYWVGEEPVVKERRQGKIIQEFKGTNRATLGSLPTIVLVNQGSASASEIVAGALQDYGKAKLVGTKTFGKGSVQDYQMLSDGSAIKITIAEWLTPKERTINKTGLTPDITVERTPEDYEAKRDPQLDRAVELLTGAKTVSPTSSSTRP
jgi:carboxyl-terminal processing protease